MPEYYKYKYNSNLDSFLFTKGVNETQKAKRTDEIAQVCGEIIAEIATHEKCTLKTKKEIIRKHINGTDFNFNFIYKLLKPEQLFANSAEYKTAREKVFNK